VLKLFLLLIVTWALSVSAFADDGADEKKVAEKSEAQMDATAPLAEIVAPEDSLPRLRYLADGKITLNDRCPVRKVALNPNMGAHYVNGQPVGFC